MTKTKLQDMAAEAWRVRQAELAEMEDSESRERAARGAGVFYEIFGVKPDAIDGSRVQCDGVIFFYNDYYAHFQLLRPCPQCGEVSRSDPVKSLSQLGELLAAPHRPEYGHKCKRTAETTAETTAERVLRLVDELVAAVAVQE